MENASKALIIAGAILLAIAIIGIGMFVYNNVSGTVRESADVSDQQVTAYNQPFTSYEGNVRGSSAKALCNTVRDHNLSAEDDSRLIGVFYGKTAPTNGEYAAGKTDGTTAGDINKIANESIQSGKTYTITFGFDPNSGLVTAVYINEASAT